MLTLVLSVVYFSVVEYDRRSDLKLLSTVDHLLTAQALSTYFDELPFLKGSDLPEIYTSAASDKSHLHLRMTLNEMRKEWQFENKDLLKELDKFSSYEIESARYAGNKRLRIMPGKICNIALAQLSFDKNAIVREIYTLQSILSLQKSVVYLVNFSDVCLIEHGIHQTLLLIDARQDIGSWVLGIPEQQFMSIPRDLWVDPVHEMVLSISELFDPFDVDRLKIHKANFVHLPEVLKDYIYFAESYAVVSMEFLEAIILNKAQRITGKIYSAGDLGEGTADFFRLSRVEAQFYGLQLNHILFIKMAPFLFFMLTYIMYRRLRTVHSNLDEISEPWILVKFDNWVDQAISYFYIATPLVFFLVILILFADVSGSALIIFGRAFAIRWMLEAEVPYLGDSLPISVDYVATSVGIMFLANLIWLIFIARYMWNILQYDKYLRRKVPR